MQGVLFCGFMGSQGKKSKKKVIFYLRFPIIESRILYQCSDLRSTMFPEKMGLLV